jgi:photosystem II stability/assembly factor-like uncharacterized protein
MNTINSFRTIVLLSLFFLSWNLSAQQWQRVSELPSTQMSVLYTQGDTLYVAGLNKLYFSLNNGSTWDSTSVIQPALDYITAVQVCHNRLYVSTLDIGIWSSADHGNTWQADNAGLAGAGAEDISGLAVRGDSLYTSTYGSGVFVKNTVINSHWSAYNQNMTWGNVESITNIHDKLFAGAGGNGTMALQAYPGDTWKEATFAQFTGDVNSFLGVIQQGEILLAAGNGGLYRSTDDGTNWTPFNPGVGFIGSARFTKSGDRVLALLIKPTGAGFIRYTDDAGETWNSFQPALTGSVAFDLAFHNGSLYAARGNGLWRMAATTPVDEIPATSGPELGQNFPNPFSESTTIPFHLPLSGKVEISVFNASGAMVRTLWSGTLPAGKHEMELDAGNLPAGMYFYRIATERGAATETMLIQK